MSVQSDPDAGEYFDAYADGYSDALKAGLAASGESQEYFATQRISWVAECCAQIGFQPTRVLDFGCGQGFSTPLLLDALAASLAIGVDVAPALLSIAHSNNRDPRVGYASTTHAAPDASFDIAYTNGVIHHIPLAERSQAIGYVHDSLRPGGLFALWENNPWNPGTRYVMRKIVFDKDAVTLSIPQAKRLVAATGFEVIRIDSLFFFPRALGALRRFEPRLSNTWMGAQYMILCRKPAV